MPRSRNRSDTGSFTLSYKTLGAIAGVFALIGGLWQAGDKIATKVDLQTTQQRISALEDRVRQAELQMARFFGARGGADQSSYHASSFKQVAYQSNQAAPPSRRIVVTMEFIKDHELEPARGGSYVVLGEDSKFYSLDDVLAVLIREHSRDRKK